MIHIKLYVVLIRLFNNVIWIVTVNDASANNLHIQQYFLQLVID